MSTVSIIIPTYNSEDYIEKCLLSAIKQTYKKIEIIVIDDGSCDNTVEIIDNLSIEYNQIKLYSFGNNLGAAVARNYGLEKATGKYVYFLDSDDYLPPETIKLLVDNIGKHEVIRGRMKTTHFANSFVVYFDGNTTIRKFENNRFNLIKNCSATNFLINKQYLMKKRVTFKEDKKIFSDLFFMIPILDEIEIIPYVNEALYIKRNRDNPHSNIALGETDLQVTFFEMVESINELRSQYSNPLVREYLDNLLLNFYRKKIVSYLGDINQLPEIYSHLKDAMHHLRKEEIQKYDFVLRREIKAINSGNEKKYKKIILQHQFLRDLKSGMKSRNKMYNFIYKHIFLKLPEKEEQVVFESFGGKNFSDSPKYIYKYMQKHKKNFTYIWALNDAAHKIPGNNKVVKRLSLRHYYYLARSKYWVSCARMPNTLYKPKNKTYLQTWHGTPLKKLAGDMDNVLMPGTNPVKYKKNFYNETKKWDYLVSPNAYSTKIFKRAFWFDGSLLNTGYPRNDILYTKNNKNDIDILKKNLKIPHGKKVILYAPTWRDDEFYSVGKYKFSLKLDLQRMKEQFGEEYVVILRLHYLIASHIDISEFQEFVYDFSDYDDISELYLISDVLITDYSSVFFDFANLKRPIIFFTYDLEKYNNQLRGFYLDIYTELPGPLLKTSDEVIEAIENIEKVNKQYADKYKAFYNRFCEWDDGNASERVVETVFK